MTTLPRHTTLIDMYTIERVLEARGLFEVTYQGRTLDESESAVLIREYAPSHLTQRSEGEPVLDVAEEDEALFHFGLDRFLEEAKALSGLTHSNVVRQLDYFEAHGTAYQVFEQPAGTSLATGLAQQSRPLPERVAIAVLWPLADGLAVIHERGLIHGGLSPEAIFPAKEHRPLLAHFSQARLLLAQESGRLTEALAPGYAAPEQYVAESTKGPWTDVYACGATLYRMVSGSDLPDVRQRLEQDEVPAAIQQLDGLSESTRTALAQSTALDPAKRPRTIQAFQQLLEEAKPVQKQTDEHAAAAPHIEATEQHPEPSAASEETEEQEASAALEEASEEQVNPQESKDRTTDKNVADVPPAAADIPFSVEERGHASDRPPHEQPAEPGEPASRRRPSAYAIAATLLVALLVGGAALFWTDDETAQAQTTRADRFRTRGDSLFALREFKIAKEQYKRAMEAHPDDAYLAHRIANTEKILERKVEIAYYKHIRKGNTLIEAGDSLLAQGDSTRARSLFSEASTQFLEALDRQPDDSLALTRMKTVAARLFPTSERTAQTQAAAASSDDSDESEERETTDPAAQQARIFGMLRNQADALFEEGDYEAARNKFKRALEIREDTYVTERIGTIDSLLTTQKQEQQYAQHMERGTDDYSRRQYKQAQAAFERALAIRPGDQAAQDRLQQTNKQLKKARDEQEYQSHRVRGNHHMEQDNLQAAISSYEQALRYKSDDAYAQEQIAKAERIIQKREAQKNRVDAQGIYKTPDQPPTLVTSLETLHQRASYPERAELRDVHGKVYVRFVVNENGKVTDLKVVRGIGSGCDEEALRVIKEARFEPATVAGNPVKAWQTLFIRF